MPDFILLIVVLVALCAAVTAFIAAYTDREPSWLCGTFAMGVIASLTIWWWATAYTTLQTTATYRVVESFEIQTLTLDDGSKYQIYIDYSSGVIHNVTRRWNKIVPEGTLIVRLERQESWAGGVRFFMPSKTKDELRGPLEDLWDGPPNERIENDN